MENQHAQESLKTKRIERAVEISAEMFLRNGIEAVKMTDIADACGVGVATLYRYFGTKTTITIAAMTHLWNALRGMYEHVFESEVFLRQPGIKRLSDLMHMYLVNPQLKYISVYSVAYTFSDICNSIYHYILHTHQNKY